MRYLMLALVACGSSSAAPIADQPSIQPSIAIEKATDLCVTRGDIADRAITQPTVRAFARSAGGDAAQLAFTYRGDADTSRALANGQARRQVGLKLRAEDGCNVIYVMWRLDPKPKLDVSIKRNPGKRTHEECGAEGYTKVRAAHSTPVPALAAGDAHTLRAEIVGDTLTAWIDGHVAWRGTLPDEARALSGPAGLRTDNMALDHVELSAPKPKDHHLEGPACKRHEHEE